MNNSEENPKATSEFKDIGINAYPSISSIPPPQSAPSYQMPPPPYQMQSGFKMENPSPGNMPSQNAQLSAEALSKIERIDYHSKLVKYPSLVLSAFSFLFLLPGAIPLFVTFIFPILGFIGAHKYNESLATFYTIYLLLINIVQIIVMAVLGGVGYIVVQVFVMVAELFILVFNIKLTRELSRISENELKVLKGTQPRNL